jgi:putative transposase
LEETFTINRLGLPPTLRRSLATTNIIENAHRSVRRHTQRVSKWEAGRMVLRWAATAFLAAESRFCKIMGYRDLWMLVAALQPELLKEHVDAGGQAA